MNESPTATSGMEPSASEMLDWLEMVTHRGYCPAVIFDDDGHWAVLFDGMQSAPGEGPPFAASFWPGKETQWHDTVRAAIAFAMKDPELQIALAAPPATA